MKKRGRTDDGESKGGGSGDEELEDPTEVEPSARSFDGVPLYMFVKARSVLGAPASVLSSSSSSSSASGSSSASSASREDIMEWIFSVRWDAKTHFLRHVCVCV